MLREKYPDGDIACFYDWDDFGRLVEPGVTTFIADCRGEDKTAEEAARYLLAHKPLFTFVHLNHVDHAGHGEGWYTPAYNRAVEKLDQLLGKMLDALRKAGMYEQTVILFTADHGGIDKKHGGDTPEERTIPWIIRGPGIKTNVPLTTSILTYDTAATLAYVLGCPLPSCRKVTEGIPASMPEAFNYRTDLAFFESLKPPLRHSAVARTSPSPLPP